MRPNPLRKRSAGERAFDLCVLPTALAFGVSLIGIFLAVLSRHSQNSAPPDPDKVTLPPEVSWLTWLPFTFGILFAVYWVWAFRSVLRSWTDPVTRVLRFCSLVLLAGQLFAIYTLLSSPWVEALDQSSR